MKFLTNYLLLFFLFTFSPLPFAQVQYTDKIDIFVGATTRPPFLSVSEKSGAGLEILSVLNTVQSKFHFIPKSIPPQRRIQSMEEGWVQVTMWDNINWGWQKINVEASIPLVQSKDVFIALAIEERTQVFFDDVKSKKLAWVNGFHYKIASFETDPDKLAAKFDLSLVRNEEAAVEMVLAKRVDVSIVSETGLNWFLIRYPEYRAKILVSEMFDTQYSRHFLVSNSSIIKTKELNQYLQIADKKGLLAPIYAKYGLNKPPFHQ